MEQHTIDRRIAALAIPALATLAADPLYDLCDTAILGHLGTHQLAGAALASRILALGYAIFIFLLFGTTASVARLIGAGRRRDAASEAVAAMWLGAALGIGAVIVVGFAGRTLISVLGGSGAVAGYAWTYLWVSLAGFPAFMLVMAGTGYLRGNGNTRLPLAVALTTVGGNLVIEIVLVYGFGFGVGASALGTVIAKWAGAIIYLVLVARSANRLGAARRPNIAAIRRLARVGRDLIVRTIALHLAVVGATGLAARQGATELAAYSIAFEIWMFGAYVSDGLEIAGHALVGGALGRNDADEARHIARRILTWSVRVGIGVGVIILVTHTLLPRAFTSDATLRAAAASALIGVACLQPINAVAFALDGILVGASDQHFLARAMLLALAAFVVAALVADATITGLGGVLLAATTGMAVRCAAGLARYRSDRWIKLGAT